MGGRSWITPTVLLGEGEQSLRHVIEQLVRWAATEVVRDRILLVPQRILEFSRGDTVSSCMQSDRSSEIALLRETSAYEAQNWRQAECFHAWQMLAGGTHHLAMQARQLHIHGAQVGAPQVQGIVLALLMPARLQTQNHHLAHEAPDSALQGQGLIVLLVTVEASNSALIASRALSTLHGWPRASYVRSAHRQCGPPARRTAVHVACHRPIGTIAVCIRVAAHPSGKMSTRVGSMGSELPPSAARPAAICTAAQHSA